MGKNTSIITNKALDFFLKEYGSFPFSSYAIVFVRYFRRAKPVTLLDLGNVIKVVVPTRYGLEPMFTVTDILLKSIATQWAGINISPQTFTICGAPSVLLGLWQSRLSKN